MNNFKKIGLSALAGSLAAFTSASAVEMSVSGSAKLTYTNGNSDEVTGNPFGMNTSLGFTFFFVSNLTYSFFGFSCFKQYSKSWKISR